MQTSKYLLANERDAQWGLSVSTVGYEDIKPGESYPTRGHADGYYFELGDAQAVVTTIHSEATMLIRKALRTIQKQRNPDAVNVTLTEDIWKPRFDRGPDYKDPPQPAGYIPDIS